MKKIRILLGLVSVMLVLFIPQAQPAERDIGYQVILPVDHNAVVTTADCPAVNTTPEFVALITDRSPGSLCMELGAKSSGLRAESADLNKIALPNADVTILFCQFGNRQCTKIALVKTDKRLLPILSHSCGGIGY